MDIRIGMLVMGADNKNLPRRIGYSALHAGIAAVFFYVLQHYMLDQPVEVALKWAGFFAVAAALLAWSQTRS